LYVEVGVDVGVYYKVEGRQQFRVL